VQNEQVVGNQSELENELDEWGVVSQRGGTPRRMNRVNKRTEFMNRAIAIRIPSAEIGNFVSLRMVVGRKPTRGRNSY
jgi:hypothetical protein